ncbi:MAG TPA: SDR family oxidoreductase [Tepidisphaeraceae bacterium]|nr:SDR family oxidoreductase [Tepidisphaeraceae bacterium]
MAAAKSKASGDGSKRASDRRPATGRLKQPGRDSQLHPAPAHEAAAYQPAAKLLGKSALITGGDSGIGRAVALLFAREGADVAIVYLPQDQEDAEATRREIQAVGRRALLIPGDVRKSAFCDRAVERTVRAFGQLDILVNNAAYANSQPRIEDVSDEQLDRTVKTNVYGYFYMARAAVKHLRPGSAIIMTGSISGTEGGPTSLIDYAMTKAAAHSLVKSLAVALLDRGIRVNCVAPGPVWTPLAASASGSDDVSGFGQDAPMKRPAQPEELAPAYVFLASNADSSYISGEVILVMGGHPGPG